MLNFSAAFNVIDHGILHQHLDYTFGISRSALSWIKSYPSDRSQQIAIGSAVGFMSTHNWCTPRFSAWTETLLHIFETNWRHLCIMLPPSEMLISVSSFALRFGAKIISSVLSWFISSKFKHIHSRMS
jgi:hypothetical protein